MGYAKTTNRIDSMELKENALLGLAFARSFIFKERGQLMSEQKNILCQATSVWKQLTEYRYIFTYGYKKQLYAINLIFSMEDFPHLAGFQYLKDLVLPRYNPTKTVDRILDQKIKHEQIFVFL